MTWVVLGGAARAWANPRDRVVIAEGDASTAPLVAELVQELEASSYEVVRVPSSALDPKTMVRTLLDANAAHAIVVAEDGKSVAVTALGHDGKTLRLEGEYALDRNARLVRRRVWISLVERLRVPDEGEGEDGESEEEDDHQSRTRGEVADRAKQRATPVAVTAAPIEPIGNSDRRSASGTSEPAPGAPDRLGMSVALGYVTRRTGLTSHLLLIGHHRMLPHLTLVAQALWPMVPGESTSSDGVRSRVWTFSVAAGLLGEVAPPSWWASPYAGITAGAQFLLAYVERPEQPLAEVYRIGSLTLDALVGVRISLRRGTWLLLQVSGGRLISLATHTGEMSESLAEAWSLRSAVGVLMSL